jgi:hypothetical protein
VIYLQKISIIIAIVAIINLSILPLFSSENIRGYGLTVFKGNKISTFEVELIGKFKNNKLGEELKIGGNSYLVRVSGEEIEKYGGISQGMSGSPVYVNGKLVGAISSTWSMTDHRLGLMIPIEEMKKLFKYKDGTSTCGKKLSSPIFVDGLNNENLNRLKPTLKNAGYSVIKGVGIETSKNIRV